MNISLDEKDFTDLVNGKIIKKDDVQIALQDIGLDRILEIVYNACQDFDDGKL